MRPSDWSIFTARCTIVLRLHVVLPSVRLSVTLVDKDNIGWKSWKLIARTISPTSSTLRSPKTIHLLPGEHREILGRLEVGGKKLPARAQKRQYLSNA